MTQSNQQEPITCQHTVAIFSAFQQAGVAPSTTLAMTPCATASDLRWPGIMPFVYQTLDLILHTSVHFMRSCHEKKPTIFNCVQVGVFGGGGGLRMASMLACTLFIYLDSTGN